MPSCHTCLSTLPTPVQKYHCMARHPFNRFSCISQVPGRRFLPSPLPGWRAAGAGGGQLPRGGNSLRPAPAAAAGRARRCGAALSLGERGLAAALPRMYKPRCLYAVRREQQRLHRAILSDAGLVTLGGRATAVTHLRRARASGGFAHHCTLTSYHRQRAGGIAERRGVAAAERALQAACLGGVRCRGAEERRNAATRMAAWRRTPGRGRRHGRRGAVDAGRVELGQTVRGAAGRTNRVHWCGCRSSCLCSTSFLPRYACLPTLHRSDVPDAETGRSVRQGGRGV